MPAVILHFCILSERSGVMGTGASKPQSAYRAWETKDFQLRTDVDHIELKGRDPTSLLLGIHNPTETAKAIKVKSTDNAAFKMEHPVFKLNPGQNAHLRLLLENPSGSWIEDHHLDVYHTELEALDPRKVNWNLQPLPVKRLPIIWAPEELPLQADN